jgi:hypothetical protein
MASEVVEAGLDLLRRMNAKEVEKCCMGLRMLIEDDDAVSEIF